MKSCNCSGPEIPRPSEKVSALASDETNQCADVPEIGQAYVGSMIELTNTDVYSVSVSEITLRFDNVANLDLV